MFKLNSVKRTGQKIYPNMSHLMKYHMYRSLSGVLFKEDAEMIMKLFLGELVLTKPPSRQFSIVKIILPHSSYDEIENVNAVHHYLQMVNYQRDMLCKHSTVFFPAEKFITLVGQSSVMMQCSITIKGRYEADLSLIHVKSY